MLPRTNRPDGFRHEEPVLILATHRPSVMRVSSYLDYNATTPLDSGVLDAMLPVMKGVHGNPSSIHHVGQDARALLDDARYRTAALWKCKPSEVVFTSGGTESNNLALFGTARKLKDRGRHLISTPVEHHAVLHCLRYLQEREGFEVTYLPVDSTGRVDPISLKQSLREDTILVSVMAANNEIGTIQPVQEIGRICRESGVLFHTDAVQWFGKEPVPSMEAFSADLVSVCAHKFHGPKGSGALFIRSPLLPDPILFGGGHENERRAGTENLAGIVGLVNALERFTVEPVFAAERIRPMTLQLERGLTDHPNIRCVSHCEVGLSNTAAFTVTGTDSFALLAALDMEGICASSGSACSAGSLEPSHVLRAIGASVDESRSLLRFSLGRETSWDEVNRLIEILPGIVDRAVSNNL